MMKTEKLGTTQKSVVLWAIDPLENEIRPDPAQIQKLMGWVRSLHIELQPVHILPAPAAATERFVDAEGISSSIAAAQQAGERYLRNLGVMGARSVKVLVAESASRKAEVECLLSFADERQALCIVVSSHGRSGLERIAVGSFAENLLFHSLRPVLFLTHLKNEDSHGNEIKHALFATDFSDFSREAFLRFLPEAKLLGLELEILHSVSLPGFVLTPGFGASPVIPDDFFPSQIRWAKEESARWIRLSESHGVPAKSIVKEEGFGPDIAATILNTAKASAVDLIVMASMSGAVSSIVLGSVARAVVRANLYPVWIYGPRALEKKEVLQDPSEHTASA